MSESTKKPNLYKRKSISVRGVTYQRLRNYVEAKHDSMSGVVEDWINQALTAAGVPVVALPPKPPAAPPTPPKGPSRLPPTPAAPVVETPLIDDDGYTKPVREF